MKQLVLLLTLQLVQLQVQGIKPSIAAIFSRWSGLNNTRAIMINSTGTVQKVPSKQMQGHALGKLQVQNTKPSITDINSRPSKHNNIKATEAKSSEMQDTNSPIVQILCRLKELNNKKVTTVNSTGTHLNVPSHQMQQHAKCCVAVFKSILRTMLKSVTVSKEKQHCVVEILNLLDDLTLPQQVSERCTEETQICSTNKLKPTSMTPFAQYLLYLKNLNKQL